MPEYIDDDGNNYGYVPYEPDEKPTGDLGDIFSDYGWSTWSDFYDDKLGLSNDDPDAQRPPLLGELEDVIRDFHDRGILDWAQFEFDGDYIDYEIDADTGNVS